LDLYNSKVTGRGGKKWPRSYLQKFKAQLAKFQQLKDQLDRLLLEKSTIENELREINKVLEELSVLNADATIYKIVGNLLVNRIRHQ
jgi:Prefoldin, chaperonin cofactor